MKSDILIRIARHLMLNASFITNLGLLNGKMGIVIFFHHYAVYTRNRVYKTFANILLDEIYEDITDMVGPDFGNGLAGIAWGIEYLVQNRFVNADTNDILADIDLLIMEWDVRRIKNDSLETGLKGIVHYAMGRCRDGFSENSIIDRAYISDLLQSVRSLPEPDAEIEILSTHLESLLRTGSSLYSKDKFMVDVVRKNQSRPNNLINNDRPWGLINNGYAGIGLNQIIKDA